jgi:hypothetical protein
MLVGKILWWDTRDNNGQIKTADGMKYYFDSSVVSPRMSARISAGVFVTFEVDSSVASCHCAKSVKVPTVGRSKSLERRFNQSRQLDLLDMDGAA